MAAALFRENPCRNLLQKKKAQGKKSLFEKKYKVVSFLICFHRVFGRFSSRGFQKCHTKKLEEMCVETLSQKRNLSFFVEKNCFREKKSKVVSCQKTLRSSFSSFSEFQNPCVGLVRENGVY
jgi:hypothetical protein